MGYKLCASAPIFTHTLVPRELFGKGQQKNSIDTRNYVRIHFYILNNMCFR